MTAPGSPPLTVRTRFAPSPTGDMHVGNLRVAIFNFLFARKHGGAFILRVEDTDVERTVVGSLDRLLEDMKWVGLHWDEGPDIGGPHGPYVQSERGDRHAERALELLGRRLAYLCFCGETEMEVARRGAGSSPGCPGGCRELFKDQAEERARSEPAAIRFAVPDETVEVTDHVRGLISFHGRDIHDFIILRADGRATYNFAVVADDVDMRITHVIRGAGHLSNTPKQALLFDALGVARPVFAHLPTVLGPEGTKLSKRTGSPGVHRLRTEGFHPDGVINYLSLLGWSPGEDREIMDPEEIARELDLDRIGASNTVFDVEKMKWVSGQHIATMGLAELASAVEPYVDRVRFPLETEQLPLVVDAVRSRLQTFGDIGVALELLFPDDSMLASAAAEVAAAHEGSLPLLEAVLSEIRTLDPWTAEAASSAVRQVGSELGLKGLKLFHPIRLALCGTTSGPDLGKVIAALGKREALDRLERARSAVADRT